MSALDPRVFTSGGVMNRFRPVVALGAVAAALSAAAQPAANAPAQSVTSSAPLRYQSAFSDYRPFQEIDVGNWKALNDQVRTSAAGRSMPTTPAPQANPAAPASGSTPMPHLDQGGKK